MLRVLSRLYVELGLMLVMTNTSADILQIFLDN